MSKLIKLECVLMGNNEIYFNGRSLGFLSDHELEKICRRKWKKIK